MTVVVGGGDVFLDIVTLSVTLVLKRFMAQTAGPEWRVGSARLNGFNGMSGMPPLTIPWPDDDVVLLPDIPLYYVVLGLLLLAYLGLRILVNSSFGNVLVAIRENPQRATVLGYDVRKYQLAAFVIGGSLVGVSGLLYTSWGQYITPSSMGLTAASLPVAWVAVGGRGDLTTTLLSTLLVLGDFQALTVYGRQYAFVVTGALLVPEGLVTALIGAAGRLIQSARRRAGSAPCLFWKPTSSASGLAARRSPPTWTSRWRPASYTA